MSWKDAVNKNRQDIKAMTKPEMSSMKDVLEEARTRTAKALSKFLKDEKGSDYQLHKHRSLIIQLDSTLKLVKNDLPGATIKDLRLEGKRATKVAVKNMEKMVIAGERKFRGASTGLSIPVAKVLTNVDRTLIGRFEKQANRYAGQVGDRIRQELAIGVVRGESVDEIAKRLVGKIKYERLKDTPTKLADEISDRQFFRNEADAQRLVRTELSNAYTEAQLESLDEADADDPGWQKRWDAANDMMVCDVCAELDGVIVGLNETFPGGVQGPPIHPNDRCCVVPHRPEWGSGPPLPGLMTVQRGSPAPAGAKPKRRKSDEDDE